MSPLDLVRLPALMDRSRGRPEITVALIDGPVVLDNPDLARSTIREIPVKLKGTCRLAGSVACTHDVRSRYARSPARFCGPGDLSRFHAVAASSL